VLEDLKRALARVQSDYGFYVDCQTNPAVALAGYDLTADERSTLTDPEKLAEALQGGIGVALRPALTVKISGSHDWVNRARATKTSMAGVDLDAEIASGVESVKKARTREERTGATLRLMELIG
jgi:hypothetical protein